MRLALLTTDNREHFKDYSNPQPYFGTAPEALLEGFKMMPAEIEVHVVSCLQKPPVSSPTKLGDNIYYHALHVPKLGWMRTGYQGCIRAVRRKLREINPDLVHGQGTERECAISAVFSGFPNVLTIHGNMRAVACALDAKPLSYYWFAARLEQFCLKRTDGVVAISTYTQRNVAPYARRNWPIPNAVHPSFFAVQNKPVTPNRILCVANIGIYKNQIGLIKALDQLAKHIPFKLVFAGLGHDGDPYFLQFQQMVNTRPWCEYVGSLARPELQRQMAAAYMGILPSLEDNCPMAVLEAAAAGLPFAASRIGGIPDSIDDGETGSLFDPKIPASIADVVSRMLTDESAATLTARKARLVCLQRFAPVVIARQHVTIYDKVAYLASKRVRP